MTAFMLGCFVAYGQVVSKLWIEDGRFAWSSHLNGVCACIAAVGLVISLLWIILAKGSKALPAFCHCT